LQSCHAFASPVVSPASVDCNPRLKRDTLLRSLPRERIDVPDGLWPILLLIVIVIVYVLAKVRYYMKESERQWLEVDKSKLREWDDDDDED
jgi:hypothetical protein